MAKFKKLTSGEKENFVQRNHKIAALFMLAVLAQMPLFGQILPKTDWCAERLKDKVKSVKTTTYQAIDKFGEINKGEVIDWELIQYNSKGNRTQKSNSDDKNYKMTYKYDNQDRITEEDIYTFDGEPGLKHVFKYDNNTGKLIQRISYNVADNGSLYEKVLYLYDAVSENYESHEYGSDGNLISKFIFDNNGKMLEEFPNTDSSINKYQYDENGKLTAIYRYGLDYYGENEVKRELQYNDKENIVVDISYESDNYLENSVKKINYTAKYKYDSKGNWIEKIMYKSEAEIAIYIEVREIEYYSK
jgi:hypothetical protein